MVARDHRRPEKGTSMQWESTRTPRRQVVVGAGLGLATVAIAGCGAHDAKPSEESTAGPGGGDEPLATTADVPVGSGVVVGDTVVTQPTAGTFTGLSSTCTHAGCKVSEVVDGEIVCPCHGSRFRLDGSVAKGPATQPLASRPVTVKGADIFAG